MLAALEETTLAVAAVEMVSPIILLGLQQQAGVVLVVLVLLSLHILPYK